MIPLYFQFVNVQRRRRECTVSSDDTVQFTATKVFNSQRPRCSTSPPYSITGKMNDIRILNDALTFIDEGRDPVKTDIRENLCTPSGRHADIARECSVAVVENDPDILYRYFSEELTACMPADVYLSVRQDVLSVLGCFEAYEELWSYTDRPDIVYQNIRYSKLGLTLKLVFREDRVEGFWMTYYEL